MSDTYLEHAEWSPSSAARWLNCTASIEAVRGVENVESEYAREGTEAHRQLELWLTLGVPPKDGQLYEELEHAYLWAIDLEEQGYDVHYEVRLKYDDDIWGTGDIVAIKGRKIKIADYKHGWVVVEVKHNPQAATYAIAAERTFDKVFTDVELVIIQPRISHRDGPIRVWRTDNDWLDWFKNEVMLAKQAVASGNVRFQAGKHCRYCPIFGDCKAAANWVAVMATGEELFV